MLVEDTFTSKFYLIKSLVQYDGLLETREEIRFLPLAPGNIVEVYRTSHKSKEFNTLDGNVNIYFSKYFSNKEAIKSHLLNPVVIQNLLSILNEKKLDNFLVHLPTCNVITNDRFTAVHPIYGIHSLFIFPNSKETKVYNIINPLDSSLDFAVFSWWLGYLATRQCVLRPLNETVYGKQFVSALASFMRHGDKKYKVDVLDERYMVAAKMPSLPELTFKSPGNINRYKELTTNKKVEK